MKKLTRHPSTCLNGLKVGETEWMDAPKDPIWAELDKLQNGFCAYCECKLSRKHIEHFRTRNMYPAETYNWSNLFGSCGDSSKQGGWQRCGIYKDNGAGQYDVNDLIKPDQDDPSQYLRFLTTGTVIPRNELTQTQKRKAEETIRVFNLNNDTVVFNSRKTAILAVLPEVNELYEMLELLDDEFTISDWHFLLNSSISEVKEMEFQTALEHSFLYNQAY
ncbi:TIGR02646 family protein [Vibrio parahaemolyticus]|uniref:Uncharacterized protein orf218 n=1 Tax=Vibrio parahaemolyticus TaxID=670 RepID=Q8L0W5_VIBPH|nr:retron Ec78 anti-phage system effector HNH endonuclease PtuB [Vibrio parahaemolyticus]TOC01173.1 TIGR02646 family protein [Vibrio parahaemolyticus]WJE04179.1 retron Ec78 anti-phage system effector HNH endonuclease PtuB [Vibrio parahaemolyticus]BAC06580.1 hypothetical protein [Vibrio parahaemolyticus]BAG74740.1 hypothetical protein [Vibrio parahaemolyticus]HCE2309531.1 TIGR02646 family protein [Vibrio parahaemolyticus]